MYYLICPDCKNKNDSDRDITGEQFRCSKCSKVFIVKETFQDAPTQPVPTQRTIEKQIKVAREEPLPTLDHSALPAASKTVNSKQKKSASKQKKRSTRRPETVKSKKSKSIPRKSARKKTPRRKSRIHMAKKQSSAFPAHLIIIIVLCAVAVIVFIGIKSSRQNVITQPKNRVTEKEKSSKHSDNIFLNMLDQNKKNKRKK